MTTPNIDAKPLAWHYTTGIHFTQIIETGLILPATEYVPKNERPAVWFSMDQHWEPTAAKGGKQPDGVLRTLNMRETWERGRGLIRFGVDLSTCPYDWRAFKRISGVRSAVADGLAEVGRMQGASPHNWRVSFVPVQRDQWVAIDAWDGANWERVYNRACQRRAGTIGVLSSASADLGPGVGEMSMGDQIAAASADGASL